MDAVDLVPMKEAKRLWQRDARTLKKWAYKGFVKYDIIGNESSRQGAWYIETPSGRQARVFNN